MEGSIKLLCRELVAELAEAALHEPEVSPVPVESLLQTNAISKGVAQTPSTTDPIAAGPTLLSSTDQSASTEPKADVPLKPQFFAKRPASASQLPQPKVEIQIPCRNLLSEKQCKFDSQVARGECESASIKRLEQQLKLSIPLVQFC